MAKTRLFTLTCFLAAVVLLSGCGQTGVVSAAQAPGPIPFPSIPTDGTSPFAESWCVAPAPPRFRRGPYRGSWIGRFPELGATLTLRRSLLPGPCRQ